MQNVVVIGTDDVLPMRRVQDATGIHDERDYAEQVGGNDAIDDSLATKWFLSDDIYGDPDPIDWLGRQLFLPDAAVGRLVEKNTDVHAQIDLFLQSNGVLDPQTALTTGYDFLADGATDVDDALSQYTQVPPGSPNPLIDPLGRRPGSGLPTSSTRRSAQNPDIASLNAHFDHQNLLSSAGNASATQDDVLNIAALAAAFKAEVVFSMGCHSGLNAPDSYGGARRGDWAQTFAGRGTAVFVGNTGYGYGDFKTGRAVGTADEAVRAEPRRQLRRRPGAARGEARLLPLGRELPGLRREGAAASGVLRPADVPRSTRPRRPHPTHPPSSPTR